jgi:hypothetical protein
MHVGAALDVATATHILETLAPVVVARHRYHKLMGDTFAVTVGRLALVSPGVFGPYVDASSDKQILIGWCGILRNCIDDEDKEHATLGMLGA